MAGVGEAQRRQAGRSRPLHPSGRGPPPPPPRPRFEPVDREKVRFPISFAYFNSLGFHNSRLLYTLFYYFFKFFYSVIFETFRIS